MMIEVIKKIDDLERELDEAVKNGDNELVDKLKFAIQRIKELRDFAEKQKRKEKRYG
jgi:vacuolar-type H+-ATPase subunit H